MSNKRMPEDMSNYKKGWFVLHAFGATWFEKLEDAEGFRQELLDCSDVDAMYWEDLRIEAGYMPRETEEEDEI